jgi:hypothetical protein
VQQFDADPLSGFPFGAHSHFSSFEYPVQQLDAEPLSEPLPRQLHVPLWSSPLQQLDPDPDIPFAMQQVPDTALPVQQSPAGSPVPRLIPAGTHVSESTPLSMLPELLGEDEPLPDASLPYILRELLPTSVRLASGVPTCTSAVEASAARTPATSTPHAARSSAPATGSACVDCGPIRPSYRAFPQREGREPCHIPVEEQCPNC